MKKLILNKSLVEQKLILIVLYYIIQNCKKDLNNY